MSTNDKKKFSDFSGKNKMEIEDFLLQILKVLPVYLRITFFVFESDTFVFAKDVVKDLSFEGNNSHVRGKRNPLPSIPFVPFDSVYFHNETNGRLWKYVVGRRIATKKENFDIIQKTIILNIVLNANMFYYDLICLIMLKLSKSLNESSSLKYKSNVGKGRLFCLCWPIVMLLETLLLSSLKLVLSVGLRMVS